MQRWPFRIEKTTQIHIYSRIFENERHASSRLIATRLRARISEAETVGRAAKRQQPTLGLNRPDQLLKKTAHILLYGHLVCCGEKLDYKIKEALGKLMKEYEPGCRMRRVARRQHSAGIKGSGRRCRVASRRQRSQRPMRLDEQGRMDAGV